MIKIEVRSTLAAIRAQQVLTVGLAGVPVHFVFGEEWKHLAKTAVFRQDSSGESWNVLLTDDRAVIPWAALQRPGLPLRIGVYGVNADGKVVIPTVWAATEPVRPGTDPQLDVSVAPALPVWQQLHGIIGSMDNLETNHKQTLVGAINEANRPVFRVNVYQNTDGDYYPSATPNQILQEWGAGRQVVCCIGQMVLQLTSIDESTANFEGIFGNVKYRVHIDKEVRVTSEQFIMQGSRLPCPNALTFTGAVEAEYDGLAPVTVEIPTMADKLPSPNKLTLTGAVEAEYDGSEPVSVEIPTGGSGVHVGSQEPEDENTSLWIDPEQGAALDVIPCPEQGEEGQVLAVKAVDADGKPVQWECTQPNDPFYVTVTEDGEGGYVSDAYFSEIKEALDQKRSVYCKLGGSVYHLDSASSRFVIFVSHGAGYYSQLRIGSDASTIIRTSTIFIENPSGAKNGQILKYVVPLHGAAGWVAADLPEGDGNAEWKLVSDVTSTEAASVVSATANDGLNDLLAYVLIPKIETDTGGTIYLDLVLQKNDGTTATSLVALPKKPTTNNTRYIIRADALGVSDVQTWSGSGAASAAEVYASEENSLKVRDVFVNGGKLLGIRVSWNLNNTLPSGTHVQLWGR